MTPEAHVGGSRPTSFTIEVVCEHATSVDPEFGSS